MAIQTLRHQGKPPRDLASRFGHTEAPQFQLLGQRDDVELWQSDTEKGRKFHVVAAKSLVCGHMSRRETAVAQFDSIVDRKPAFIHVGELTTAERQRERDRMRTAMQAPIAAPRYRVLYLVNGRERKSAWLYSSERARQGLRMMRAKYGERNAIIYLD